MNLVWTMAYLPSPVTHCRIVAAAGGRLPSSLEFRVVRFVARAQTAEKKFKQTRQVVVVVEKGHKVLELARKVE
jgi:hypothetical protein